jgi:hypothetical protein
MMVKVIEPFDVLLVTENPLFLGLIYLYISTSMEQHAAKKQNPND